MKKITEELHEVLLAIASGRHKLHAVKINTHEEYFRDSIKNIEKITNELIENIDSIKFFSKIKKELIEKLNNSKYKIESIYMDAPSYDDDVDFDDNENVSDYLEDLSLSKMKIKEELELSNSAIEEFLEIFDNIKNYHKCKNYKPSGFKRNERLLRNFNK